MAAYLDKVGSRFNPGDVSRAKTIGRVEQKYQRDFVDVGLLPLLEEQAGEKLTDLVEGVLGGLRAACGKTPDDKTLFKWVFRLLAGKLLRDKGVAEFRGLDLKHPKDVFAAVANHLGVPVERIPPGGSPATVALAEAGRRLDAFAPLAYVTTRTLAHLYETGLLNKKKKYNDFRKRWGIHNTPWWLADYLVWKVIDWVREIPLEQRRVLDPGCGAATMLVSSITMLREVAEEEGVPQKAITAHLRNSIEGFDTDSFGLEIARLSLTLADLPNHNGWKIEPGDMFDPGVIADRVSRCPIIFANPPYERFTPLEQRRYAGLRQSNKAAELVEQLVAELPTDGVLGLVLPQGFLHATSCERVRQTLLGQFEIREITLFPDKVFNFSDAEACLLLARRRTPSTSKAIRFRWIREPDVEAFEKDYRATAEQNTVPARFLRSPHAALRIPQLDEVWASCQAMPAFRTVAEINKGLEYRGRDLPEGAATVSGRHFNGAIEGFAKLEPVGVEITRLPRLRWMSLSNSVIRRPGSGTTTGIPQILLSYARVSRGPWRLKAFIDRVGRPVTSRFLTVRPSRTGIPLELLWAVCNSSFANAYTYSHSMKREILAEDLRAMPLPPFTPHDAATIEELVQSYFAATEEFTNDGPSLFSSASPPTAHTLDDLLKQIDAQVLRLYNLPPRLERRVLDLFDQQPDRQRPGVLAAWTRYYPEGLKGPISYCQFLADEDAAPKGHAIRTPVDKYSLVVRDESIPDIERAALLLDLARSRAEEATDLVEAFLTGPLPDSIAWAGAVVTAAETVRFTSPEQRNRVQSRLREWALELRDHQGAEASHALRTAIRRYATLVPTEDVNRLVDFLRPQDRSTCWLVVFQGVQNVFSKHPPLTKADVAPLARRTAEIAKDLIASKQFAPGSESALVANALQVLAVLDADEALSLAKGFSAAAPGWLRGATADTLNMILGRWEHDAAEQAGIRKLFNILEPGPEVPRWPTSLLRLPSNQDKSTE